MFSDQDITKLKEIFPTKKEFGELSDIVAKTNQKVDSLDSKVTTLESKVDTLESKVDILDTKVNNIQEQVGNLSVDMGDLNDKMDSLHVKMDGFVGSVRTLQSENGAGAAMFARQGRQLQALARHLGV